jgi:hypothetical protein
MNQIKHAKGPGTFLPIYAPGSRSAEELGQRLRYIAAINRASVVPVTRRSGKESAVPVMLRFDTVSAVLVMRRSP